MRTDPHRTGILRLRPVMPIAATPVAESPVTIGNRRRFPPVVSGLRQGLHQQLLKFIAIQQPEFFSQKLLVRMRGKSLSPNHFTTGVVSICRVMHWYRVKKPKSKAPLPGKQFRSQQFPGFLFPTPAARQNRAGAKQSPAFGPRLFSSNTGRGGSRSTPPAGTQLSAAGLPYVVAVPKTG